MCSFKLFHEKVSFSLCHEIQSFSQEEMLKHSNNNFHVNRLCLFTRWKIKVIKHKVQMKSSKNNIIINFFLVVFKAIKIFVVTRVRVRQIMLNLHRLQFLSLKFSFGLSSYPFTSSLIVRAWAMPWLIIFAKISKRLKR